ncbi:hypothetical protein LTR35_017869 [Friedmanniomyces endolithicus]|nr:hypothetical protein LTR35_017869 [Friedmanniomyces endolithicus]KAK0267727.1 hypothetical protein LTS00_017739 [Friedmanniomyces endolithicus]KAK0970758.1 hypothetical protein LTR54_017914 [Friedmanniomyces endolithicus]
MSVWSSVFECPVYTSIEDEIWLEQLPAANRRLIETDKAEIVPGVSAIKTGGHFDGSLLLHWQDHLFHADTFLVTLSGLSSSMEHVKGRTVTYSFMYSPPNMLPLAPAAIQKIWTGIKPFGFKHTHGAFSGQSISGTDLKERLLDSMRVFIQHEGHSDHEFLDVPLDEGKSSTLLRKWDGDPCSGANHEQPGKYVEMHDEGWMSRRELEGR